VSWIISWVFPVYIESVIVWVVNYLDNFEFAFGIVQFFALVETIKSFTLGKSKVFYHQQLPIKLPSNLGEILITNVELNENDEVSGYRCNDCIQQSEVKREESKS
jgi:hypothetical protein